MTKLRLPVDAECQQCQGIIPANTLLFEHQGKFFCSEEDSVVWKQQQRLTRTERILDLCIAGSGLKEAVARTA